MHFMLFPLKSLAFHFLLFSVIGTSNIDEIIQFSNGKNSSYEIKQVFIKNKSFPSLKEWNDYNPDRVKKINEILHDLCQNHPSIPSRQEFPQDLGKLIGSYDHINPIRDVYDQVMSKLILFEIKEKNLDFHDDVFPSQFSLLLKKISIPKYNLFWYDLSRLVFKWTIIMRQRIINDIEFSKVLENIEFIILAIFEKGGLFLPFNFEFESMDSVIFELFKKLIKFEFIENPHIFPSFASILKHFYGIEKEITKEKRIDCKELKMNYFNGNYNKNILLKYLIVMYDPKGRLAECIIQDDPQSRILRESLFDLKEITEAYIENLRIRGPKNLEIPITSYISKSVIEFCLSTGKRVFVTDCLHLIHLLRKLKEMESLSMEIIERIVGFEHDSLDEESLLWNQEIFEKLLDDYREYYLDFKDDCLECDEYSKLIHSL